MVMEINSAYNNVYESAYAAQKQETAKKQAGSRKETSETVGVQKNSTVGNSTKKSTVEYMKELEKLVPSVECKIGNTFSSAKNGKTLTINPKLLEKMQDDPNKEKKMKELIRGVESATKLLDSIHRASGWSVVYRHGYIDENGNYSSCAYVRNDFMLNMSDKLREERKENSERLIEKSKERATKKREELQDKSGGKRSGEEIDNVKKIVDEKIANSKDGMVYLSNTDMKIIIETAAKEDKTMKDDGKEQIQVGVNLDLKI